MSSARHGRPAGGDAPVQQSLLPRQTSEPYPTPPGAAAAIVAAAAAATAPERPVQQPPPTSAALQALLRECKMVRSMRLKGELPVGIDVAPRGDNLTEWAACIFGPPGSPYEGGTWNLDITFPHDYPMSPPRILFRTPICHPNINPDGRICLDVTGGHTGRDFHKAWSAALTIDKVLLQIVAMMGDPNFKDPWVPMSPGEWRQRAAVLTREKAMGVTSLVPQEDLSRRGPSPKPPAPLEAADFQEEEMEEGDDSDDADSEPGDAMSTDSPRPGGRWAEELAQLKSLGCTDSKSDEELLAALGRCRGNVSDVFELLTR
eukprot:TRINITY_DN50899_c0_g1_i1.p1 TRINITY_DN50899_c0_g1~~TRINITY_DN50899_c0_g1_i1.p1  ORF type:complete len:317 (+),score=77.68 TRINITY_DN50899_c0_g1_i1:86-1036(+)